MMGVSRPGIAALGLIIAAVGSAPLSVVAQTLDPRERAALDSTLNHLARVPRGPASRFHGVSPSTGRGGVVIVERTFFLAPDRPCRAYRWTAEQARGPVLRGQGTGCRIARDNWSLHEDPAHAAPATAPRAGTSTGPRRPRGAAASAPLRAITAREAGKVQCTTGAEEAASAGLHPALGDTPLMQASTAGEAGLQPASSTVAPGRSPLPERFRDVRRTARRSQADCFLAIDSAGGGTVLVKLGMPPRSRPKRPYSGNSTIPPSPGCGRAGRGRTKPGWQQSSCPAPTSRPGLPVTPSRSSRHDSCCWT